MSGVVLELKLIPLTISYLMVSTQHPWIIPKDPSSRKRTYTYNFFVLFSSKQLLHLKGLINFNQIGVWMGVPICLYHGQQNMLSTLRFQKKQVSWWQSCGCSTNWTMYLCIARYENITDFMWSTVRTHVDWGVFKQDQRDITATLV